MVTATMRLPLRSQAEVAATLVSRGVFRPMRPDRFAQQLWKLWRWGSTIAAAFVVHAVDARDQPALTDEEGELTYGEVDRRTNALARGLEQLGVREGNAVAILARNGRGFVEPLVACSKLGADVLLLNTSFSAHDLRAVVERERPQALIHDAEFSQVIEEASLDRSLVRLIAHPSGEPLAGAPTAAELIELHDDGDVSPPEHEGRTVILTSGTTGTPKGARVAQPDKVDPLAWFLRAVPLRARSTHLIAPPLFHAHGFSQFAIGSGLACKLVLPRTFDAEQTLALIERERARALVAVPIMLKRIMELTPETRGRYDTSSLQVVLCSGSMLPPQLALDFMAEFGEVIYDLYGSTELSGATIASPRDIIEAPGTVGRPLPQTRIAILDDDGRVLQPGAIGRIFVGNELLFEGYTDGSRLDVSADGLMSAGDLGHLDDTGRLFIDARADDMIISGGENVYPAEVETVLTEHPLIDEVAAVGVDDERFGQRFVVFVVPKQGADLTPDAVMAYAKKNLSRYKVPREVRILEQLPRNALGKVLRKDLRREAAAGAEAV